jgi:hypothetical protein
LSSKINWNFASVVGFNISLHQLNHCPIAASKSSAKMEGYVWGVCKSMKKLLLPAALLLLSFCIACGDDNGNGGGGGPTPQGNFSNASLSGQYTYRLQGTDLSSGAIFREAGVFTADGNGNISSGTDDFSEGTGGVASNPITGTYAIANDGTGTMVLNVAGGSITLGVTLVSSARLEIVEADGFANANGAAERQTASAFAAPPAGTFAFRSHIVTSSGQSSTGVVGVMTISGGVVTSGFEDVNTDGSLSSPTLSSGVFNFPDNTGRGTGSFTDNNSHTTDFIYYVVDANNFRFLSSDPGILSLGRAEIQTGPFSDTSFNGSYAFGASGDTLTSLGGIHTVGRFAADGAGTISEGAFDEVEDGNVTSNGSIGTGAFTVVDATGRCAITLNTSNGTRVVILQLVDSSHGYILMADSNLVEDGTITKQAVGSFTQSTMNGQFAFVMSGFDPTSLLDRVGTLQWDGNGNLLLNELLNRQGAVTTPGFLNGTYAVSSNGRATGAVDSLSTNLVFYLISGSDGYILQGDTGTEVSGNFSVQH